MVKRKAPLGSSERAWTSGEYLSHDPLGLFDPTRNPAYARYLAQRSARHAQPKET